MYFVARLRRIGLVCAGAVFLAISAGTLSAGVIEINSNSSLVDPNGSNSVSPTGANVVIPPSPAWQLPIAGGNYTWISYSNTGCSTFEAVSGRCTAGQNNPAGYTNPNNPTATFYETFVLPESVNSGNIMIWADDTASAYLDFGKVTSGDGNEGAVRSVPADFTWGSNCAAGSISCTSALPPGTISVNGLGPGTYTLVIDAYQFVGGTPFGVMYTGSFDSVPEPTSYVLMGLGLVGIGVLLPRARRR